jgi:hypothetical protein
LVVAGVVLLPAVVLVPVFLAVLFPALEVFLVVPDVDFLVVPDVDFLVVPDVDLVVPVGFLVAVGGLVEVGFLVVVVVVGLVVVPVTVGVVVVVGIVVVGVVVVSVGVVVVSVVVVPLSSDLRTAGLRTEATEAVTDAALAVAPLELARAALAVEPVAPLEELFELLLLVELLPVDVPSSTSVRLSSASVRLACASSSVSSDEDGSSVATSCPFLTWPPTFTSTLLRVPEVPKLSVSSTPGSTSPLPETVVWTTPFSALTSSVDVRAALVVGVPSWVTPKMITPAATAASRTTYHGRTDRRLRFRFIPANLWINP